MTDRELMQMALDALESSRVFVTSREQIKHPEGTEWYDERIEALRARLAQPEQEPVAWRFYDGSIWCYVDHLTDLPQDKFEPLYTAPPQRKWQGLTEDEVAQAMFRAQAIVTGPMQFKFAKEIEAKLKEKNA